MIQIKNFIDGTHVAPAGGKYLSNWNPAQGTVYSELPDSDGRDADRAIGAAQRAFGAWSSTPVLERSSILRRISQLILQRKDDLALAESIDTGKPVSLAARMDIPRAAQNFEFFADAITQYSSQYYSPDQSHPFTQHFVQRSPLGVVVCISPWNLPLYLLTWKIAPALAAGNCVVAKPSEITPMTAHLLSQICIEAGLPKGVLNFVHGTGAKLGETLCRHPLVRAISFTGSTATGGKIAEIAAPLFKKLSLEMGGKNPTLLFADCDIDAAVEGTVRAAYTNQGEICLCGSRILVEQSIYPQVKQALIERISQLKVGDPLEPSVDQGALVSQIHYDKVLSYLELAKTEGGSVLSGGESVKISGRCENGWFVLPTLIENLGPHCRTNQEEIFGPVATLQTFETEEEALALANSTQYGLSAVVWTQDLGRAHRMAQQIQAGLIWINSWLVRDLRVPFGGVKNSGVGREGGNEALNFFTEPKSICIQFPQTIKEKAPKKSVNL